MKRVYVVFGHCGQYEDSQEWPVGVFPTKVAADNHKRLAQAETDRLQDAWRREYDAWVDANDESDCPERGRNKYDRDGSRDGCEEVFYSVRRVRFFEVSP